MSAQNAALFVDLLRNIFYLSSKDFKGINLRFCMCFVTVFYALLGSIMSINSLWQLILTVFKYDLNKKYIDWVFQIYELIKIIIIYSILGK